MEMLFAPLFLLFLAAILGGIPAPVSEQNIDKAKFATFREKLDVKKAA